MAADFSIDGMIRYFEMAHKVMGWTSTENSYEHHVAQMLKKLREERDEARQEICIQKCDSLGAVISGSPATPQDYAEERGWDCFKEANDAETKH
jgi:hypothetical protein